MTKSVYNEIQYFNIITAYNTHWPSAFISEKKKGRSDFYILLNEKLLFFF